MDQPVSPTIRGNSSVTPSSMQPTSSYMSSMPTTTPTEQDIEAVIQMATSARPVAAARDTRTQLFVGNLPYRVRWQDLKDLFRKAGTVLRADVSLGPDNRSRGYGTVLLGTAEDAGRAIDMFNGYSWQTRILEVRADRMPPEYDINCPFPTTMGAGSLAHTPLAIPPFTQSTSYQFSADSMPPSDYRSALSSTASSSSLSNILTPSSPTQLSTLPSSITSNSISRSASRVGMHAQSNSLSSIGNGQSKSIFVGNLPFQCQWQDLKDLFRQVGPVVRADVALGPDGRSRGFGTVLFQNDSDADKAVALFHGYEYNNRVLKVHHDKFTQVASSSPPFAVTVPPPHLQYGSQHASYMGPSPSNLIPSHIHQQASLYPFHSQPTSPYDPYPPALPRHMMEQYLGSPLIPRAQPGYVIVDSMVPPPKSSGPPPQYVPEPSPLSSKDGYPSLHNPAPQQQTPETSPRVDNHPSSDAPQTPPKTTSTSPRTGSSARPGTIAIPPPPAAFAAPGVMFSPLGRGLPPMTPSMPGFTFHPQVSTPPGLLPHFLSPGLGPNSPPVPFFHRAGTGGSYGGGPAGGTPMSMMMYAMQSPPPPHPMTPGQHMMLTPGPRLNNAGGSGGGVPHPLQGTWVPVSPDYAAAAMAAAMSGPFLSPPISVSTGNAGGRTMEPQGYFPTLPSPLVAPAAPPAPSYAEAGDYFPPVSGSYPPTGGRADSEDAPELTRSTSASESEAGTATTTTAADSADESHFVGLMSTSSQEGYGSATVVPVPHAHRLASDPLIRTKVGGLSLDEKSVPDIVNEIALASGMGTAGAAKKTVGGGAGGAAGAGKWMSQKPRFTGGLAVLDNQPNRSVSALGDKKETLLASAHIPAETADASAPGQTRLPFPPKGLVLPRRPSKTDLEFELDNPGLFALPSPGLGRRASWAEPAARRPTATDLHSTTQAHQYPHEADSR